MSNYFSFHRLLVSSSQSHAIRMLYLLHQPNWEAWNTVNTSNSVYLVRRTNQLADGYILRYFPIIVLRSSGLHNIFCSRVNVWRLLTCSSVCMAKLRKCDNAHLFDMSKISTNWKALNLITKFILDRNYSLLHVYEKCFFFPPTSAKVT